MSTKKVDFKVTLIQFFTYEQEFCNDNDQCETHKTYSSNIIINDNFIIQCAGNNQESGDYSIPRKDEAFVHTEQAQEFAYENYDLRSIVEQIEKDGFENNYHFLDENCNELFSNSL